MTKLTPIWLETRRNRAVGFGFWTYLYDGVLVDSGHARARSILLRELAGKQVLAVANTHIHEDHAGNDAAVARAFGVPVFAPASTLHLLADPKLLNLRFYERLIWGEPEPFGEARPLGDTVETATGKLQVIPTPGHSPDHVVFFEPEGRWVFSGDLFLGVKVRAARPFENVPDLAASLRRVLALRPKRMLCAHRGVIDDPVPVLEAKLRFTEELLEEVRMLHDAGFPAERIARKLRSEPLLQAILTGSDFSRVHLVRACLKAPGTGYEQPGSVTYRPAA